MPFETKSQFIKDALFEILNKQGSEYVANTCMFCGRMVEHADFVDSLSRKEWEISRLCQHCQDESFRDIDEYEDEDYRYEEY